MTARKSPVRPKAVAMCCVTIDHNDYLLPMAHGMKLVELLQHCLRCHESYESGTGYVYLPGDKGPQVTFKSVAPSQLRAPVAEPAQPVLGIEHQPPRFL